jgi:DNA-binding GntR family transcriptional regulator
MRRQEALSPARLERESREHGAILAALQARDAGQAEEITRRHIRHLSEELAGVLSIPPEALEPLLNLCR